jgi:hypothetical protein
MVQNQVRGFLSLIVVEDRHHNLLPERTEDSLHRNRRLDYLFYWRRIRDRRQQGCPDGQRDKRSRQPALR